MCHTKNLRKINVRTVISVSVEIVLSDFCEQIKHFSCQGLTRTEAEHIIALKINWTCKNCIYDILPVNGCRAKRKGENAEPAFKVQCTSCGGYCYSLKNIRTCCWCETQVHFKCHSNYLGCISCCEKIIPGFYATSYELNDDYERLNSFTYNPYKQDHFTNLIGDVIEAEEHHNSHWSEISDFLVKCKYTQQKHVKSSGNCELKLFSLNIRNLQKGICTIRENIDIFNKYDILAFNETNLRREKLANGTQDVMLEYFHEPLLQNPISNKGGGMAIYVNKWVVDNSEDIETITPYPDPENFNGEFQFVKIHKCKGFKQTKVIANIYRSPSRQIEGFNSLLDKVLWKINRHSKKHVLLAGDFNADLIKYDNVAGYQELIDIMSNHGFVQLVSRPTRITDSSATLIDHVYTNNLENTISCNIVTVDISDHLATLTTIKLGNSSEHINFHNNLTPGTDKSSYRIFNEANDQNFKNLIAEENWSTVVDQNLNADKNFENFMQIYNKNYNKAYPLKNERVRRKNERLNPKPWILPWLEDAIARKENLFHESIKFPTAENINAYKKMNEFCEKHKKIAQGKYYNKYFDQYKDNSKKQWQMINNVLGRKVYHKETIKLKDGDGNTISSGNAVAEKFNDFFSNIASNLKTENTETKVFDPGGFNQFLGNPTENSIYLRVTSAGEVHSIIKTFKNKATLDTKISPLKIANENRAFTETLATLINSSFEQGIFPDSLKTAKVVPIHKDGPKTDVSNYRPISLLDSFSKIYEKLMHQRIIEFLDKNNILFDMQYGFRPGRSCEQALLNAQNSILNSLSKREITMLLLIDFSKAFDMIEHQVLLTKLEHYGVRGVALDWFKSYLSGRRQYVSVNGATSSVKPIKYGVPQGSILGPLLFVIYINDLPNISKYAKFILYADDANILLTGKDTEEILKKFDTIALSILKWVNTNGLALNLKKTKCMIFSRQQVFINREIKIGGVIIDREKEARFLGVIVDDKLNWSKHIATVKAKMARYVGMMYKLKYFLPLKARIQIFQSFVQSHLNYCSIVWGFAAKSNIELLFRNQKKAMRAVMPGFVNYFYKDGKMPAHTKTSFHEYGILSVHGIITKNALIFMHKIRHFPSLLPPSIRETIPHNAPIVGSNHENCSNWLEKYGQACYTSSIFGKGPLLAITDTNTELTTLPSILSLNIYEKLVKLELLKQQNIGDPENWPNFLLYAIPGLRKSCRNRTQPDYYQST